MKEFILHTEKVLLTRADLKRLGIEKSNVTLLRAEAKGKFPSRARLNGCSVVWFRHEVEAWLQKISDDRANHFYCDLR